MIDPTADDIGGRVVFYGKQGDNLVPAYGRVTGVDAKQVFVRCDSHTDPAIAASVRQHR